MSIGSQAGRYGKIQRSQSQRTRYDDSCASDCVESQSGYENRRRGVSGGWQQAIFYYIADERVDFRQLIKVLAEAFRVRIEMKQIGARQEAGRIGGIGPCGRELCCATWMTSFVSVSTSAARFQDISLNPQKLAGQCAKLKCCLNYEVDCYVEAQKRLPSREIELETKRWHFLFLQSGYSKQSGFLFYG